MPDGPLGLGMTLLVIPSERSERRESSRIAADTRRTCGPGHDGDDPFGHGYDATQRCVAGHAIGLSFKHSPLQDSNRVDAFDRKCKVMS